MSVGASAVGFCCWQGRKHSAENLILSPPTDQTCNRLSKRFQDAWYPSRLGLCRAVGLTPSAGYEMSEKELEQVMAALDGSGSQRIGYKAHRFLSVVSKPRRLVVEPRVVYSLQLPIRKWAVDDAKNSESRNELLKLGPDTSLGVNIDNGKAREPSSRPSVSRHRS